MRWGGEGISHLVQFCLHQPSVYVYWCVDVFSVIRV